MTEDDIDRAAQSVLTYWFEELSGEDHFRQSDTVDAAIAQRFGTLQAQLAEAVPPHWLQSADNRLAAVIVLDQFSRNIHRGDPRAYEQDSAARAIAERAIDCGDLDKLPPERAMFLAVALMHAEDEETVERSRRILSELEGMGEAEAYARRHRDTIARFGRYPRRNVALRRDTTDEEAAFLDSHPEGFVD